MNGNVNFPIMKHSWDSVNTKATYATSDEHLQRDDLMSDSDIHLRRIRHEEDFGQETHISEPIPRGCASHGSKSTAITTKAGANIKTNKTLQTGKDEGGPLAEEDEGEWTAKITKRIIDDEALYFRILRYEVQRSLSFPRRPNDCFIAYSLQCLRQVVRGTRIHSKV